MRRLGLAALVTLAACGNQHAATLATVEPAHSMRPDNGRDFTDPTTTTSSTARPSRQRASRNAGPRVPPARGPAPSDDVWLRLAQCESGMRQDAVSREGDYSYFQFKLATWRSVKAFDDPDDPRLASYDVQKAAAIRLQARSGWSQWPSCSRRIGTL